MRNTSRRCYTEATTYNKGDNMEENLMTMNPGYSTGYTPLYSGSWDDFLKRSNPTAYGMSDGLRLVKGIGTGMDNAIIDTTAGMTLNKDTLVKDFNLSNLLDRDGKEILGLDNALDIGSIPEYRDLKLPTSVADIATTPDSDLGFVQRTFGKDVTNLDAAKFGLNLVSDIGNFLMNRQDAKAEKKIADATRQYTKEQDTIDNNYKAKELQHRIDMDKAEFDWKTRFDNNDGGSGGGYSGPSGADLLAERKYNDEAARSSVFASRVGGGFSSGNDNRFDRYRRR
jgi:hypothetical protein